MAEPLRNQFGSNVPEKIAAMVSAVFPPFSATAFIRKTLDGYDDLALIRRGWKIAEGLRQYLPDRYETAAEILVASLGPKLETTEGHGMTPFLYLPHVLYVAKYGLNHFDASMRAQYELTQRFTAEFSIRPFLARHQESTLARLEQWTRDPSPHVRRLVSEGTRPRLPWAPRLREFQKDPRPVLNLLELLKDDSEGYVRRSVANNLNDIGKDHPSVLVETARRWMKDATPERRRLIHHALRSAVKRAELGAIAVMGFSEEARILVSSAGITPKRAAIGGSATIALELKNPLPEPQRILVDFRVHFIKSNGKSSPKVFKLKSIDLAPGQTVKMSKTISLAEMTTRKHYPGTHRVDVVLNGSVRALGEFELLRE